MLLDRIGSPVRCRGGVVMIYWFRRPRFTPFCQPYARARFLYILRAGAMRLDRIGPLCRNDASTTEICRLPLRDALPLDGVARHRERARHVSSLRHGGLVPVIPWRAGADESGAAKKQ